MAKDKVVRKTIWQLDKERPTNCPNFGSRRECGKPGAISSGCKVGLCAENLQAAQEKAEAKAARVGTMPSSTPAKRATPRRLRSQDAEGYLAQLERENRLRPRGTKSEDGKWVWHTAECCSAVWRPVSWGCVGKTRLVG